MEANKTPANFDNTLARYEQLKKDFVNAERISHTEKNLLVKIINTFSAVVATHGQYSEEAKAIKKIVNAGEPLPLDKIEDEIAHLKEKIFAEEQQDNLEGSKKEQQDEIPGGALKASSMIRQIQVALTENFYPLNSELKQKAEVLRDYCKNGMSEKELEKVTEAFISFINGLKLNIANDIKYINHTFLTLSSHVKELETTLMSEFGGDVRIKEIEQFETKINDEVGSIVDSFNLYKTIDQIKATVIEKLSKIKNVLSLQKKEELKKSQRAEANIDKLKKRIALAEKEAHKLSKKAEYLQVAATKDRLTSLNNRDAFDSKIRSVLNEFENGGKPFSLALFDIDNFKWINDTFGHVSGDKVLKRVGECLRESFRKHDFIARYGGDEFAVIVEEISREMVRERIVLFNRNFQKKRFRSHDTRDVNVTVSVGIAAAKTGEHSNDLIHRADMDMYASKKNKSQPS